MLICVNVARSNSGIIYLSVSLRKSSCLVFSIKNEWVIPVYKYNGISPFIHNMLFRNRTRFLLSSYSVRFNILVPIANISLSLRGPNKVKEKRHELHDMTLQTCITETNLRSVFHLDVLPLLSIKIFVL